MIRANENNLVCAKATIEWGKEKEDTIRESIRSFNRQDNTEKIKELGV